VTPCEANDGDDLAMQQYNNSTMFFIFNF